MFGLILASTIFIAGCGHTWQYTFVEAEHLAKQTEKPILILYRNHLDVKSGQIETLVESPEFAPYLNNFVLCSLVSAYDPNRRYMAQFGVTAPPALVIIHPDLTYHTLADVGDLAQIKTFVTDSKPPGRRIHTDIAIPRPTDYLVRAEGIYEQAFEKAKRLNRDLLIVYKWWLSPESGEMLANMSRPEVASRCAETVNCVLDWDYVPNRTHVAQYGVTRLPAIIVVRKDGAYARMEGLASVEEIVGFLTTALGERRTSPSRATSDTAPNSPPEG